MILRNEDFAALGKALRAIVDRKPGKGFIAEKDSTRKPFDMSKAGGQ